MLELDAFQKKSRTLGDGTVPSIEQVYSTILGRLEVYSLCHPHYPTVSTYKFSTKHLKGS